MSLAQQIEQIIAKELGSVFDREKKEIAEHIIKWLTKYCEIIDEKAKEKPPPQIRDFLKFSRDGHGSIPAFCYFAEDYDSFE